MREIPRILDRAAGARRPLAGSLAPKLVLLGLLGAAAGCSSQDHEESLPIIQVGMKKGEVEPIYDDGEMTIYEVKKGISFPILAPSADAERALAKDMDPYGRTPWVTTDDIDVQVSWTLSNLDDEPRNVEVLIDPWNEFGRYYPGLQLTDADEEEYMPNFSGIDKRYVLEATSKGDASRVHGTYTFSDLKEMATDFATVMNLLAHPPMLEGADEEDMEDPTVTYTNHAFNWQNRSYRDPLVQAWVPKTVAGLTGLDLGFRTYEEANVAIEIAVEVVDKNGKRVRREGDEDKKLLPPTEEIITVGVAPP